MYVSAMGGQVLGLYAGELPIRRAAYSTLAALQSDEAGMWHAARHFRLRLKEKKIRQLKSLESRLF